MLLRNSPKKDRAARKEELSEMEVQGKGFLKTITFPNNKKILLNQNSSISATESLLQMQPE